jgi:Holliday junction DNA helicase RuvA
VIARLDGTLIERDATHVIVDCAGVGYEVRVSMFTLAALPAIGERVTLRVYTHASENALALFGFADPQERQLFDLLLKVKNVGPTTAIGILSGGSTPRDIAALVAREDVAGLTRIKGVGKKTAELLVVEIKDKCEEMLLAWTADGELRPAARPAGASARPRRHAMLDEVAAALVGMGWRPVEADQAVAELVVDADTTLEALLRQALRGMPR